MKKNTGLNKNIAMLVVKKVELQNDLHKPILKGLGYEEVLLKTEKLIRIDNAISYLNRNLV